MSDTDLLLTVLVSSSAGRAVEVQWVSTTAQNRDLSVLRRWCGVLGKTNCFGAGQIDLVSSLWSSHAGLSTERCGVRASSWGEGCERSWNWGAIERLSELGGGKRVGFGFYLNCWCPCGEYLVGVYCCAGC